MHASKELIKDNYIAEGQNDLKTYDRTGKMGLNMVSDDLELQCEMAPITDTNRHNTKHNTRVVLNGHELHGKKLKLGYLKTCECPTNHLSCITAKEWIKCQLGVWQFFYEKETSEIKRSILLHFLFLWPEKL